MSVASADETVCRLSREAALAGVLRDLHASGDELRQFVLGIEGGKRLLKELRDGSLVQMVHDLVLLLDRHDRVDAALFRLLLAIHPRASPAIVELAERWGVHRMDLPALPPDRPRWRTNRHRPGITVITGIAGFAALAVMVRPPWAETKETSVAGTEIVVTRPEAASPVEPAGERASAMPSSSTAALSLDPPELRGRDKQPPATNGERTCSQDVQERYSSAIPNEGNLRRTYRLRIRVGRTGIAKAAPAFVTDASVSEALAGVDAAIAAQQRRWTDKEVPCEYTLDWRP